MKKTSSLSILVGLLVVFFTTKAFSGNGPVGIGSVKIGMSKDEYVSTVGIDPINCNTYKDSQGKPKRSELEYLMPESKRLCWELSSDFSEKGIIEHIEVSGISYDIINAGNNSSKVIGAFGHRSKAIFLDDKLISLEIVFPKVSIDTITTKYGEPRLVDNRKIEICKNRIGNEFENKVGNLDAIWMNGDVRATLRAHTTAPRKTCTDGFTMPHYILEVPSQLQKIERAIGVYREKIAKKEAKDSPF